MREWLEGVCTTIIPLVGKWNGLYVQILDVCQGLSSYINPRPSESWSYPPLIEYNNMSKGFFKGREVALLLLICVHILEEETWVWSGHDHQLLHGFWVPWRHPPCNGTPPVCNPVQKHHWAGTITCANRILCNMPPCIVSYKCTGWWSGHSWPHTRQHHPAYAEYVCQKNFSVESWECKELVSNLST